MERVKETTALSLKPLPNVTLPWWNRLCEALELSCQILIPNPIIPPLTGLGWAGLVWAGLGWCSVLCARCSVRGALCAVIRVRCSVLRALRARGSIGRWRGSIGASSCHVMSVAP